MGKTILILITLISLFACVENKNEKQKGNINNTTKYINEIGVKQKITIGKRIERLKDIFYKHKNTNDKKKQNQLIDSFFCFFPDNFPLFVEIYGYKEISTDSTLYGQLYNDSYSHIKLFFKSNDVIEDSLFIKKIIDISINGFWESDAVAIFKSEIVDLISKNNKSFYSVLKNYKVKDIKSFWKFYFNEPHPDNLDLNKIYKFRQIDQKMFDIIDTSYKQALKDAHISG